MHKITIFSMLLAFFVLFTESSKASTNTQSFGTVYKNLKVCKMGPLDPRRAHEDEEKNPSDDQSHEAGVEE